MYLGWKIAQQHGCPYDIRLDGCPDHYGKDLSEFVLDIVECLKFIGIEYRRIYWQPQNEYSEEMLNRFYSAREQALLKFIRLDKGHTDLTCILDDVEHAPSIIVRGNEFENPDAYVGNGFCVSGMLWHKRIEQTMFDLAGVENLEINVPLITMGGYKMSKTDGRAVHWRVLETIGIAETIKLFEQTAAIEPCWEWQWSAIRPHEQWQWPGTNDDANRLWGHDV
jgi:hypothetical protein